MFGIENFSAFILVSVGLAISPGPDILYVLTRGVAEGRKPALAAAAGFSLGNIVHLTLITLGVSALIAANPLLLTIIKFAGAAYLLFIAWQIWNSPSLQQPGDKKVQRSSAWRVFRQSVLANLLNPKVILFFLALFPQFINETAADAWKGLLLLGAVFIALTWLIFSLVAIFAGELSLYLAKNVKLAAAVPKVAAVILAIIALLICIK